MSRRDFVGGLLGSAGLLGLGCSSSAARPATSAPSTDAPTTEAPTTSTSPASTSTSTTSTTAPPDSTTTTAAVAPDYFPTTDWETVAAADVGWDRAGLDEALAFAESRSTKALVLLHGGRILAERYVGVGPDFRREVASCQKSIVSLLVGIAADRSLLALDDPVTEHLGVGWSNAAPEQEALITIRHLVSMTSGLDDQRRVVAPPGTVWSYNNDAYHQVQPVLETVTRAGIDALCTDWLWRPIGAIQSSWAPRQGTGRNQVDAKGVPLWGLTMSARDMARFGLLVQRHASWDGATVLGPGYLTDALSSSSAANPSYGYLWWLNGKDGYRIGADGPLESGPLVPGAPADLVAALGKDDQKIYVSRAEDVVLVRQGGQAGTRSRESLSDFDGELWRLVAAARA